MDSGNLAKHILRHLAPRGPYHDTLRILDANPYLEVRGRVYSTNSHYVHERSTAVELTPEGWMGATDTEEMEITQKVYAVFESLQETLEAQVVAWNRAIAHELYASLENATSDETLIEWLNNTAEWRFDEDGRQVSLDEFGPIDSLKPDVRARVLKEYADLFDRTPEQVYATLVQRNLRYDRRGNRVDLSQLKRVDELPEQDKTRILDANRDMLVEDEGWWAGSITEAWTEKLEALGFQRVEIRYSLGYSQGDGASFESDSIDVKRLCTEMVKQQQTKEAARATAANLLA